MSTRNVDTAIRYALSITQKGLKEAVALTTDLSKQSKVTQTAVDTSMKAVQAQYKALESIAVKADQSVARSAIDSSTTVNKALDAQIAKLREAGSSYQAIMAKQREMGASAADLAASIKRSSESEIASMRAVRAEADRTVRQRLSMATSNVGGAAAAGARGIGGLVVGGTALGAGLAYESYRKAQVITESATQLHGATGLDPRSATALAVLANSTGVNPRTISQAFATSGAQLTKALAGNATAQANFKALGITDAQGLALRGNSAGLIDTITGRLQTLPQTQQAALARTFLGRGAAGLQPLLAEGALGGAKGQISKEKAAIGDISPKDLAEIRKNVVELNKEVTNFELHFIKAFGPTISTVLKAIAPLLAPVGRAFEDAFKFVGDFFKSSTGKGIISGLESFGKTALDAAKKLLDAFKPAEPVLKNVILPLLKGIAEGIGIGLIGAIKIATPIVKVISDILGAFGDLLKPLKPAIEDIGKVLGIVFGPGVIGKAIEFVAKLTGEIPLVGKVLGDLLRPVEFVGQGIGKLYDIVAGTFSKIFGFIPGVGSKLASLLGNVASSVVGAFAAVPDQVGQLFSGLGDIIGQAFDGAVNVVIGVLNTAIDGINAVSSAIPLGLGPAQIAHITPVGAQAATGPAPSLAGGVGKGVRPFAAGGLVPAMVSPGEMIVHGGMAATVPGPRTAADSVFAMLPAGAAVMTGHGQAMMAMGASLGDAIAGQLPHFASGTGSVNALGWNVAAPKGKKPEVPKDYIVPGSNPPRLEHVLPSVYRAQELQYRLHKPPAGANRNLGLTFSGPASTFGPPGEAAAITAYGGTTTAPGVALNPHGGPNWNDALARSLAGKAFRIEGAGHSAVLKVIDKGPSAIGSHGPRKIDITGAGVTAMGLNPSAFPTDSIFKATEVVGGVASAVTAASLAKQTQTLKNTIAALTGQAAFAGGYQAGLAGNTLMDTLRSGVLSSLIGDVAVNTSTPGTLSIAAAANVATGVTSAGGRLVPPGARFAWDRIDQGQDITTTPGGPLLAMGAGKIIDTPNNPGGFGFNYPVMAYTSGPFARRSVYYGHTHSVLGSGASFRPGQVISKTGFGTPREGNARVPGWAEVGFWPPGGMNAGAAIAPTLHKIMGMRRGGIAGFRVGGVVKGSPFHPQATKRVNPLAVPLASVSSLLAQSDATDVSAIMAQLASLIDDAHAQTFQSLQSLAASLAKHSIKGLDPIKQRRLSTALNLVDAAIGNRIGLAVQAAQDTVDAIGRSNAHKIATSTLAGIDPSSATGLAQIAQLDKLTVQGLNAQIGTLNQALVTAKKYGDRATIKDVTDRLNTALANLDNAAVQALNDWKAAVEKVTQDAVDASTQAVSVAQANEQLLSLQQQLAGTDQTPGGQQASAAFINSTVIPALQRQLQAQQADQAAAASVGDQARVNADILAELQTQTNLAQEQLTAAKATAVNTQPLKALGGQLAFNFNGESMTDRPLVGLGVGT